MPSVRVFVWVVGDLPHGQCACVCVGCEEMTHAQCACVCVSCGRFNACCEKLTHAQ